MANSEVCTLYDCKNQTNSYDFLRTELVHALLLSVSFKPTFVVVDSINDMLALLQFSYCHRRTRVCFCVKDCITEGG